MSIERLIVKAIFVSVGAAGVWYQNAKGDAEFHSGERDATFYGKVDVHSVGNNCRTLNGVVAMIDRYIGVDYKNPKKKLKAIDNYIHALDGAEPKLNNTKVINLSHRYNNYLVRVGDFFEDWTTNVNTMKRETIEEHTQEFAQEYAALSADFRSFCGSSL